MAGVLAPMLLSVFKNGQVLIGGKIKAYTTGTTTAKAIYQDAALTTPWASSIATTDSNGVAKVYLDQGNYRLDFHDTDANGGGFLYRVDPVSGASTGITLSAITASTTVTSTQNGYIFATDATLGNITVNLPDTSTLGDGFKVTVGKIDSSSNTVSIAAFASQNIEGQSTITLSGQWEFITLISRSTGWYIIDRARALYDQNMKKVVNTTGVSSAVNNLNVSNAATGNNPKITSEGSDSNIGQDFEAKGTGTYNFKGTSAQAAYQRWFEDTDNGTNYLEHQTPASLAANRTVLWPDSDISQHYVQEVYTSTTSFANGTTQVPYDDTIPQNTEGDQYLSLSITPKNTNNILIIDVLLNCGAQAACRLAASIFQDSGTNAIAIGTSSVADAGLLTPIKIKHRMVAGTTSATTFKVRMGGSVATNFNVNGEAAARVYGGVLVSSITIREVTP